MAAPAVHYKTSFNINFPKPVQKSTRTVKGGRSETDNNDLGKAEASLPALDLKQESERLKTFTKWKNSALSPETLAKAGFYSLDHEDVVRCAFCNAEGYKWEEGDDPMQDHIKWNPACPFVREKIPADFGKDSAGEQDVCGSRSLSEVTRQLVKKIAVSHPKPCTYAPFKTLESRLRSFADWPKSLKQEPGKLSEAGFFYRGSGDHTMCYHCGGGLKDWEDNDDPWEQHALWFPNCYFLVLSKGQEFVDEVQRKFKAEDELVPPPTPNACSSSSSGSHNSCSINTSKEEAKGSIDIKTVEAKTASSSSDEEADKTLCKICYKNELGVVFIPCGHMVACVECALSLKDICPVCRKPFETSIRVFLS